MNHEYVLQLQKTNIQSRYQISLERKQQDLTNTYIIKI